MLKIRPFVHVLSVNKAKHKVFKSNNLIFFKYLIWGKRGKIKKCEKQCFKKKLIVLLEFKVLLKRVQDISFLLFLIVSLAHSAKNEKKKAADHFLVFQIV